MSGETTHSEAGAAQVADAAHEATGHAADAAGHAAEAVGMPQLDFTSWPNQIFWLLVTLVIIYFVLTRIALPRIEAVLAERQGTITSDIATAEELKQKAVEAEEAYNKALADARAEANQIVAQARAEIQAEVDGAAERADAEIAARAAESEKAIADIRAGALDNVREVANAAAQEVLTAFGAKADAKAVAAAVEARLKG